MAARKTSKKTNPQKKSESLAELSFEDSLERLSHIVEELESGDLTLEQSLARFEEGVKLSHQSQVRLNAAESRVEELLKIEDDGRPVVEEFSHDSLEEFEAH